MGQNIMVCYFITIVTQHNLVPTRTLSEWLVLKPSSYPWDDDTQLYFTILGQSELKSKENQVSTMLMKVTFSILLL